jgi:hypothetical protein
MGVDIGDARAHVVLAPLGDVDFDAVGVVQAKRVPSALSMFEGLNFSAKMLIIRKMSAFSSTPALMTGGSLWASTTFLPLMVTSSRRTGFAVWSVPLLACGLFISHYSWVGVPFFTASSTPLTIPS